MVKVKLYNSDGEEKDNIELSDQVFKKKMNSVLIHQAVVAQLANSRVARAHTKTRAEVSGGGKKPFKQKGTGRARAGTIRSPLWTGGGVVFGPRKNRNYSKKMPKKMKRAAISIALSEHVKNKSLFIIDKLNDFKKISTKQGLSFIKKFPVENKSILMILDKNLKNLILSLRNIPKIKIIRIDNINVLDILNHDTIITTKTVLSKRGK